MENQRVRLSKSMLKNALIQLLQEKNIEKITIYELCQTATINRTTFYKYYGDQYDLLQDIENDCFSAIEDYLSSHDYHETVVLTNVLDYIESEKMTYRVLFNQTVDQDFPEKLFSLPRIIELIDHKVAQGDNENDKFYTHQFVCHGGFAVIRSWLNKEDREPASEIAMRIKSIMSTVLSLNA